MRVVAILALAFVASCGAGTEELQIDLQLDPSPPRVGDVQVALALSDASGAPLVGADVHVEGNMNHAGMVPELADATSVGEGRYVADIEFTMGGDWFFVVTARTDDGRRLEGVVDVLGVSAAE